MISRFFATLLLLSASLFGEELRGRVVKVTDGDTITVFDADKVQHKIRLEGIDAPESKQAFGTRAKEALGDKVFDKEVLIEWKETDRYKRILGHVRIGERNINREMVEEGFAWHFKQYSKSKELSDAEVEAREARRGLWIDKSPVPPWEFRKQQREKSRAKKSAYRFQLNTPAGGCISWQTNQGEQIPHGANSA